ncbi:hypothetical protein J4G48_0044785 [Bradyrhizobium barranii subsp. apii]|uniref:hypothetical protein n=1 Tax=Bradyrhizobium barranii TaxID=2992140 RepID=UPI001AA178A3|nr:hypothetical protein [Bradyrhizobium barranii]UPT96095.1 hypothetical protein J4G48_0044785 [Bradyrhizobium barranii subsp. apii]
MNLTRAVLGIPTRFFPVGKCSRIFRIGINHEQEQEVGCIITIIIIDDALEFGSHDAIVVRAQII